MLLRIGIVVAERTWVFFAFEGIDAHLATKVFGLASDWDQINGDTLEECEHGASLSLF